MLPVNIRASLRSPQGQAPGSSLSLSLQEPGFSALHTHGISSSLSNTELPASRVGNPNGSFLRKSGCPPEGLSTAMQSKRSLFYPHLENTAPCPSPALSINHGMSRVLCPSPALSTNHGISRVLCSVQGRGGNLLCNEEGTAQHSSPEQMEPLPRQETFPSLSPGQSHPHTPSTAGEFQKWSKTGAVTGTLLPRNSPAATEEPLV